MVETVGAGVMTGQQKHDSALQIALSQIQSELPAVQQGVSQLGGNFTSAQASAISAVVNATVALNNAVAAALPLFGGPAAPVIQPPAA